MPNSPGSSLETYFEAGLRLGNFTIWTAVRRFRCNRFPGHRLMISFTPPPLIVVLQAAAPGIKDELVRSQGSQALELFHRELMGLRRGDVSKSSTLPLATSQQAQFLEPSARIAGNLLVYLAGNITDF